VEFSEAILRTNCSFPIHFLINFPRESGRGTENEIDYVLTNNREILQDISVLNSLKISSDHRMLRCKLKLNNILARKKLIRGNPSLLDLENLGKNRDIFKIELSNRFSTLEELEGEEDINSRNKILTEIIRETAKEIADIKKKSIISEETKLLTKKRREMKEDKNYVKRVEYIELNKTIRKKIREDIRRYNQHLVRNTIEKNKNLDPKHSVQLTHRDLNS